MSEEDKELSQHMNKLMNPRVRDVDVGIRTLRKAKLYPLSIPDQTALSTVITEGFMVFAQDAPPDGSFTPAMATKLVDLVKVNLPKILKIVFPDEKVDKLLKELDNYQIAEIAEHVFRDNYGDPVKKLASLFMAKTTMSNESAMERLSQLSAGITPPTESSISPDSATEKGESQAVS